MKWKAHPPFPSKGTRLRWFYDSVIQLDIPLLFQLFQMQKKPSEIFILDWNSRTMLAVSCSTVTYFSQGFSSLPPEHWGYAPAQRNGGQVCQQMGRQPGPLKVTVLCGAFLQHPLIVFWARSRGCLAQDSDARLSEDSATWGVLGTCYTSEVLRSN